MRHYVDSAGADDLSSNVLDRVNSQRRLAFVGQGIYFAPCALDSDAPGLESGFFEYREGEDPAAMLAAVRAFEPDVAFFFKPELVPAGLLRELACVTVGYATEPLPSLAASPHRDLAVRRSSFARLDPANFDRMLVYNSGIAKSVSALMPVWRCVPLPVADRYYREPQPTFRRPRVIFVGRSTEHRESLLLDSKHRYDVVHIAHGVGPVELETIADTYDVGINLHNESYPNFENRVCLHLAAGHLVLSEPLTPTMGLEPGIDFIQFESSGELSRHIGELVRSPDLHLRVRIRGRQKAELFRASRVYPSLVDDLLHDIAVFGTERSPALSR